MKILLVHNSYQQPGGEDVVFEQEHKMLERGGHTILTYRRSNWEVAGYSGLRRLELLGRAVWARDARQDFTRLLNEEKPDLVHVHNTFVMISPSIYSACQQAGVPVVQTLHNYRLFCPAATFFRDGHVCEDCVQHGLLQSVKHSCYRHSRTATGAMALVLTVHRQQKTWTRNINCYIALSQFSRGRFVTSGLPAEKIFVKPNFVHPDPGPPVCDQGDYALFVGRLSPEKRVSTVLAAWERLHNRVPLVVIGGGPERTELEKHAFNLGLSSVSFCGQVSREQTIAAMHHARFLVFSSEWYENFPVTIAESFACGVPVLCSGLGAMQEIVEHECTGLHFTPGDPGDLAEKADWAWNHPDRMNEMGKAARQDYEAKYTAEKNYPQLIEIYHRAIENQGRTAAEDLYVLPVM